jgi:IS30 family transposase
LDNDLSFVEHTTWKKIFTMQTYFCDPYCSWQKGAVERANLWLREKFPRNIQMGRLIQHNLDQWVELVNERPTKCLDYQMPKSVFMLYIPALKHRSKTPGNP